MRHATKNATRHAHKDTQRDERARPSRLRLSSLLLINAPLLVALLMSSGCGAHVNALDEPAEACLVASKSYPRDRFLLAEGSGVSPTEALNSARAELSSVISAQLRSALTISTSQREGERERQSTQQEVQVSSRFKHAELIKPVLGCERCVGERCEVKVALDRDEAATRMIKELGPDVERLNVALKSLTAEAPLTDFTPAWYSAQGAYQRLLPSLNQLEVIGRVPPELLHINDEMRRARAVKAERLQRLALWFAPLELTSAQASALNKDSEEGLGRALRERLSVALEQTGLKAWSEGRCPQSDDSSEVLMISPKGALRCSLGLVGPQCTLSLSVSLSLCNAQAQPTALGAALWSEVKLVGVHPQEERLALERLTSSLSSQELTPHLARLLSPFVAF